MTGRVGQASGKKIPNSVKKIVNAQVNRQLINKKEPEVPAVLPDMPIQLSDVAKHLYVKYGMLLLNAGILKETDGLVLASYCQVSADILEAFEQNKRLKREQLESVGYINFDRLNPCKLLNLQRQLGVELGLTPVMRGRLEVEKVDEAESEWAILDATG